MNVSGKRIALLLLAIVLMGASLTVIFPAKKVDAAQITNRSLTLQAGASDGGSKPGGVVKHFFTFTLPSSASIGSIQFLYCTSASGACVTPTGLVTTAATLTGQTGLTGFTMVNTTAGAPYITRSAASGTGNVTYQLSNVTNPTGANQTFFTRITTFTSTTATTGATDAGTVAASTANQIVLSGTMPESLIFCTGATVSTTGGIPDCATATSGTVSFNQLFSPTDTAVATSQMAASTNATSGYAITVNGPTLTNGVYTIPAMSAATTSIKGTGQFGMNLKLNSTAAASSFPFTSAEAAPTANGTNYRGQASTGYATADSFKFTNGEAVAKSDNTAAGPTDSQIFTSSYIVNVSGSQPAGTYTSTLTYICTATF